MLNVDENWDNNIRASNYVVHRLTVIAEGLKCQSTLETRVKHGKVNAQTVVQYGQG